MRREGGMRLLERQDVVVLLRWPEPQQAQQTSSGRHSLETSAWSRSFLRVRFSTKRCCVFFSSRVEVREMFRGRRAKQRGSLMYNSSVQWVGCSAGVRAGRGEVGGQNGEVRELEGEVRECNTLTFSFLSSLCRGEEEEEGAYK